MNERMKQLYEQAHEPQPPIKGKTEQTKNILWGQPDKFNPEKFAELIVRECVQILDDFGAKQTAKLEQPAHHPGLNFLVGLKIVEATWKIKTHFGVEE